MKNIIIADTHELYREALCSYIRHSGFDWTVTGAGSASDLSQSLKNNAADLVLLQKGFPDFDENDFFKKYSDGGVLKFGTIVSDLSQAENIDPQIHGVFLKTLSGKEIFEGILDVLAGKKFYPKAGHFQTTEFIRPFLRVPQDFSLTNREKEVLSHLVKGASNKDIARALDLQVVTVKLHVRGICRKMKAQNRTQAALIAQENGWGSG